MSKTKIQPSNLEFLKQLKKNNNRDWFNANKDRYLKEHENIIAFADALLFEMNKHDVIENQSGKKSLHRIYKDTRFSKDKTPYKSNWSGGFQRATKSRRGGYYFHIEAGNTFVAGGFWGPEPKDLKRIRDEFISDAATLRKILKNKKFADVFGKLEGEKIKTTPKGYDANSSAIDLLRFKQFYVIKKFTDKEVLSENFPKQMSATFKAMRPFFDYMTEVLTTDVNGVSVV